MDSHRFNMYAGSVIGALLVFLLLNFFTDLIYVGRGHSEHEPLAFAVEVEADAGAGGEAAETVDLAALVASADAAEGEKVFKKCKACHQTAEGADGVGPNLYRIVGRSIGGEAGFSYSDGMKGHGGVWNLETLSAFLESPKTYVAGTKMSFNGLAKAEDRVNLIVYLNEAGGAPVPLAE